MGFVLALGLLLGGCARPAGPAADDAEALPYRDVQVMPFVPIIAATGQPGLALAAEAFVAGERVVVVAARFEDLQPGTYELSADLKDGSQTVTGGLQRWEQEEAVAVVIQGLSLKADLKTKKSYTVEVKLNGRLIAKLTIPTQ